MYWERIHNCLFPLLLLLDMCEIQAKCQENNHNSQFWSLQLHNNNIIFVLAETKSIEQRKKWTKPVTIGLNIIFTHLIMSKLACQGYWGMSKVREKVVVMATEVINLRKGCCHDNWSHPSHHGDANATNTAQTSPRQGTSHCSNANPMVTQCSLAPCQRL